MNQITIIINIIITIIINIIIKVWFPGSPGSILTISINIKRG